MFAIRNLLSLPFRRIFTVIFAVCFFISVPQQGRSMKTTEISNEMLQKYTEIARKYVLEKKGWTPNEYELKFIYLDTSKKFVLFSCIHQRGIIENRMKRLQEGKARQGIHPSLEFSFLIDTVDFSVQENNLEVKFRHAPKD